ncbi:gamma-glutamylcyclotransferase [Alteromonas gilva]|uniref:Gamma-glutamylcyclotransferase n=1 Tax=Alteromonas gilva TaxID=2987522 RepID=A0ABT5L6A8_9ALTE|nr:gamma-glutamylcyclotransferase [Alteromonas gilva]MDC8832397.1 gamma-glutamylcyclotransferase [Alteromonas gilva]
MKTLVELERWIHAIDEPHIVLGYGSLMNGDSRRRHSDIPHQGIEVEIFGFERAWITRSQSEMQTYVGATAKPDSWLNAQLVPTLLDPALQKREQDYQFTPVALEQLNFELESDVTKRLTEWLSQRDIWICESLAMQPPEPDFPVNQSYIDTCLAGCLELGGMAAAQRFIDSTRGWDHNRCNDRSDPRYPRAANVSSEMQAVIDTMLQANG